MYGKDLANNDFPSEIQTAICQVRRCDVYLVRCRYKTLINPKDITNRMFLHALFITPMCRSSCKFLLSKSGIIVTIDAANLKELVALVKKWNLVPQPEPNLMHVEPTLRRRICYEEGDYHCDCYKLLMERLRRVLTERTIALNCMLAMHNRTITTGSIAETTPKRQLTFEYPSHYTNPI